MSLTIRNTPRSALQLLLPLLASVLLPAPSAETEADARPNLNSSLAMEIADQGNRALLQIREESRLSLRRLSLPSISGDARADGGDALFAANEASK